MAGRCQDYGFESSSSSSSSTGYRERHRLRTTCILRIYTGLCSRQRYMRHTVLCTEICRKCRVPRRDSRSPFFYCPPSHRYGKVIGKKDPYLSPLPGISPPPPYLPRDEFFRFLILSEGSYGIPVSSAINYLSFSFSLFLPLRDFN